MNVRISVFVICVKAIIYLLSYNFHDCTFKTLNQISKYGAPLFPKNALRKEEKRNLHSDKNLKNQNFMLIK